MALLDDLKHWLRPFFIRNPQAKEDFDCANCGKALLRRVLFCSDHCTKEYIAKSDPPKPLKQRRPRELPKTD